MESKDDVILKANYCLNCPTKPCSTKGCPIGTKIPEFIQKIKENNNGEAYTILADNNICSHICSIVCPQEKQCEGSCVRGIKSTPTEIGKLERYVNEWADENKIVYDYEIKPSNGKSVAIIGSGPAGISCAFELLKEGFKVDMYEKDEMLGGILYYGIPDFRLEKSYVEEVFGKLNKLGLNTYTKKELGKDIELEELEEKYDAIFIAFGASKPMMYSLGEESKDIFDPNTFIRHYSEKNYLTNLGKVAIIGGGNVAMDAARVAAKMGAKEVKILYRRDRAHMPASQKELDDAIYEDGVIFKELVRVDSGNFKDGKLESLNCVRTKIVDGKAVDDTETFIEEADQVVFAIGLKPDIDFIKSFNIELDDWNYIKTNEDSETNIGNVFAGGDCVDNRATVCVAILGGKKAAKGIIKKVLG